MVVQNRKLPVQIFSAGASPPPPTPRWSWQLGAEASFVGSGIFMERFHYIRRPAEAEKRARAIVKPQRISTTLKYYLKSAKIWRER